MNNNSAPRGGRIWNAAFYIRLSKEDVERGQGESASVANQREILKEFIKLHPDIRLVESYEDDGVSGTTFDRPAFARLKEDIERGKIDCVVVKDLSRFGRNYAEGGALLDNYFAEKGVRFISVNNGIDTFGDGMNTATRFLTIGMSNLINESYVASTSVNIRGTLNNHRRQGKFIGAFACYGYKKSPEDRHRLIIDEEAAEVVRLIFREYIGGNSILGIAKKLNSLGLSNPTLYKQRHGFDFALSRANDGLWCDRTVRRILQNEMYIGNMVQGINSKISYKINRCRAVPKDGRIIVRNTHEPVVDRESFAQAQSLLGKNIHGGRTDGKMDLFAGFIFCADCGRAMQKKTNRHSYGEYIYYKCAAKQRKGASCTNHTVRADRLNDAVLGYLKNIIALAADYDEIVRDLRQKRGVAEDESLNKSLEARKREREQCLSMIDNLYPAWQTGLLTREEFIRQKDRLNQSLQKLDEIIAKLGQKTGEGEKEKLDSFVGDFLKHRTIDRLTRPLLLELIDKIYARSDGSVTIKLKCDDVFEELIERLRQENAA